MVQRIGVKSLISLILVFQNEFGPPKRTASKTIAQGGGIYKTENCDYWSVHRNIYTREKFLWVYRGLQSTQGQVARKQLLKNCGRLAQSCTHSFAKHAGCSVHADQESKQLSGLISPAIFFPKHLLIR